jgi:glycosyltransferase involved in cell wall biosynthesis
MAAAYGAQQRVLNIARLLSHFGEVSFVIVPTVQEDEETARRTKHDFNVCKVIRPLQIAPDSHLGWSPARLRHEFDPTFMATDHYAVSDSDRAKAQELFERHDIVWVHTIRTANWFRILRWPHSVLDVDDLPSRALSAKAHSGSRPLKRLLDLRRSWIWRRRERLLPDRFDVLTVCSEDDRQYLSRPERIHVIPNGAHCLPDRPRIPSGIQRIGLIGNCEFMPNEEGVKWFVRDAWPGVKREFPGAQLRLVGRGSEGYLAKLGPDITGLGWLEDPGEEIAT